MRYLKKFEGLESNSIIDINKLMEFCNNSLVYLLDEGFELDLQTRTGRFPELRTVRYNGEAGVNITCSSVDNYTWLKLKDYYIPFLRLLTRRYKLYPYYQPQRFDLNGNLVDTFKMVSDCLKKYPGANTQLNGMCKKPRKYIFKYKKQ